MGQTALKRIENTEQVNRRSHLRLVEKSRAAEAETRRKTTASVIYIGVFLAVLQALDGILTAIGVDRFGTPIEGNPFLRTLMEEFGHVPTLAAVKLISISIVILLTLIAHRISWVRNAMGALSCVYIFAAIIPWTYILFVKPYIL